MANDINQVYVSEGRRGTSAVDGSPSVWWRTTGLICVSVFPLVVGDFAKRDNQQLRQCYGDVRDGSVSEIHCEYWGLIESFCNVAFYIFFMLCDIQF